MPKAIKLYTLNGCIVWYMTYVSIMQARKLQRLGRQASTARGTGSIPHQEIEIPHAAQRSLKKKLQVKKTRPGEMKVQRQDWAWFCAEKMLELGKEYMRAHTRLPCIKKQSTYTYMYMVDQSSLAECWFLKAEWWTCEHHCTPLQNFFLLK